VSLIDKVPDFSLCIACGTIVHEWENCNGFCAACQRDETLGDQNIPLSHVARKLDLKNRDEAYQTMQIIRAIRSIGIHRTTEIIAKIGELI